MVLIGSALQRFIHNCTRVAAELWVDGAGDNIHFRQRIWIRRNARLIQQNIIVTTVTVAPERTAPEGSVMVPLIDAVVACALA